MNWGTWVGVVVEGSREVVVKKSWRSRLRAQSEIGPTQVLPQLPDANWWLINENFTASHRLEGPTMHDEAKSSPSFQKTCTFSSAFNWKLHTSWRFSTENILKLPPDTYGVNVNSNGKRPKCPSQSQKPMSKTPWTKDLHPASNHLHTSSRHPLNLQSRPE